MVVSLSYLNGTIIKRKTILSLGFKFLLIISEPISGGSVGHTGFKVKRSQGQTFG